MRLFKTQDPEKHTLFSSTWTHLGQILGSAPSTRKPQYLEKTLSEKEQKPRLNPHKTSHALQDSKTGRNGKRKNSLNNSSLVPPCPNPNPYLIFSIEKLRQRHFRSTHINKSTLFAFLSSGFAQIFWKIVSIRVQTLDSDTNLFAYASLPVEERCLKIPLLELPIITQMTFGYVVKPGVL